MVKTSGAFWKMVGYHHIGMIICLSSEEDARNDETHADYFIPYWPQSKSSRANTDWHSNPPSSSRCASPKQNSKVRFIEKREAGEAVVGRESGEVNKHPDDVGAISLSFDNISNLDCGLKLDSKSRPLLKQQVVSENESSPSSNAIFSDIHNNSNSSSNMKYNNLTQDNEETTSEAEMQKQEKDEKNTDHSEDNFVRAGTELISEFQEGLLTVRNIKVVLLNSSTSPISPRTAGDVTSLQEDHANNEESNSYSSTSDLSEEHIKPKIQSNSNAIQHIPYCPICYKRSHISSTTVASTGAHRPIAAPLQSFENADTHLNRNFIPSFNQLFADHSKDHHRHHRHHHTSSNKNYFSKSEVKNHLNNVSDPLSQPESLPSSSCSSSSSAHILNTGAGYRPHFVPLPFQQTSGVETQDVNVGYAIEPDNQNNCNNIRIDKDGNNTSVSTLVPSNMDIKNICNAQQQHHQRGDQIQDSLIKHSSSKCSFQSNINQNQHTNKKCLHNCKSLHVTPNIIDTIHNVNGQNTNVAHNLHGQTDPSHHQYHTQQQPQQHIQQHPPHPLTPHLADDHQSSNSRIHIDSHANTMSSDQYPSPVLDRSPSHILPASNSFIETTTTTATTSATAQIEKHHHYHHGTSSTSNLLSQLQSNNTIAGLTSHAVAPPTFLNDTLQSTTCSPCSSPPPARHHGKYPYAHEVVHVRYAAWNDMDGAHPSHVARLVALMQDYITNNPDRPIIVHCSAGVGRAGTLVAALCIAERARYMAVHQIVVSRGLSAVIDSLMQAPHVAQTDVEIDGSELKKIVDVVQLHLDHLKHASRPFIDSHCSHNHDDQKSSLAFTQPQSKTNTSCDQSAQLQINSQQQQACQVSSDLTANALPDTSASSINTTICNNIAFNRKNSLSSVPSSRDVSFINPSAASTTVRPVSIRPPLSKKFLSNVVPSAVSLVPPSAIAPTSATAAPSPRWSAVASPTAMTALHRHHSNSSNHVGGHSSSQPLTHTMDSFGSSDTVTCLKTFFSDTTNNFTSSESAVGKIPLGATTSTSMRPLESPGNFSSLDCKEQSVEFTSESKCSQKNTFGTSLTLVGETPYAVNGCVAQPSSTSLVQLNCLAFQQCSSGLISATLSSSSSPVPPPYDKTSHVSTVSASIIAPNEPCRSSECFSAYQDGFLPSKQFETDQQLEELQTVIDKARCAIYSLEMGEKLGDLLRKDLLAVKQQVENMKCDPRVSVLHEVLHLRSERANLVATTEQFRLIFSVLNRIWMSQHFALNSVRPFVTPNEFVGAITNNFLKKLQESLTCIRHHATSSCSTVSHTINPPPRILNHQQHHTSGDHSKSPCEPQFPVSSIGLRNFSPELTIPSPKKICVEPPSSILPPGGDTVFSPSRPLSSQTAVRVEASATSHLLRDPAVLNCVNVLSSDPIPTNTVPVNTNRNTINHLNASSSSLRLITTASTSHSGYPDGSSNNIPHTVIRGSGLVHTSTTSTTSTTTTTTTTATATLAPIEVSAARPVFARPIISSLTPVRESPPPTPSATGISSANPFASPPCILPSRPTPSLNFSSAKTSTPSAAVPLFVRPVVDDDDDDDYNNNNTGQFHASSSDVSKFCMSANLVSDIDKRASRPQPFSSRPAPCLVSPFLPSASNFSARPSMLSSKPHAMHASSCTFDNEIPPSPMLPVSTPFSAKPPLNPFLNSSNSNFLNPNSVHGSGSGEVTVGSTTSASRMPVFNPAAFLLNSGLSNSNFSSIKTNSTNTSNNKNINSTGNANHHQ